MHTENVMADLETRQMGAVIEGFETPCTPTIM